MTGEFLPLSNDSPCRFQHVFNEDAIAGGWVIYQYMGRRTHQFPILDDGAAGHADVK